MPDADARGTIHGVKPQQTGPGARECINTQLPHQCAPLGWSALTPTGFLHVPAGVCTISFGNWWEPQNNAETTPSLVFNPYWNAFYYFLAR